MNDKTEMKTKLQTPQPLLDGNPTFSSLTEKISRLAEQDTPKLWFLAFGVASTLAIFLFALIGYLVFKGIGVWGLNIPVAWGWAIINFVFWIGIGHAGTLISAILFLLRQGWRTSINRFAEAMTLFAVMCALIFPAIHVGRIWVVSGFFPIPIRWPCGPIFAAHCCGMCSLSRPTFWCR